jgi:hypothetical protein
LNYSHEKKGGVMFQNTFREDEGNSNE